jgi:alginate O-acetyltransferase complex protein AlgI
MPVLLAGWNLLQNRVRSRAALWFLTGMSGVFYALFGIEYLLIILASVAVTYFLSAQIGRCQKNSSSSKGRGYMILGVILQLAFLGVFKYSGFFLENINSLFGTDYALKNLILPVGISFYTFSQIAYLVDRYRGEIPHADILEYTAFVLYFPKILQGPIALPGEIISQFGDSEKLRWNTKRVLEGAELFITGLAKKVLLADTMALIVNYTFSQPYYLDTLCVTAAGVSCALNIYFDFSGYCDMADGVSRMLGIELPVNFNSPFKSCSVRELWQRWHVTLSRFLVRYVYIPLGGSRTGEVRTVLNILIMFFLSGLWHGAGWTYVVWGLLNGIMVICDHLRGKMKRHLNLPKVLKQIMTFLFFSFSVIFFRADTLTQAFVMVRRLFFFTWPGFVYRTAANLKLAETYVFQEAVQLFGKQYENLFFTALMIIVFAVSILVITGSNARERASRGMYTTRHLVFLGLVFTVSVLSLSGVQTYVYFKF